MDRPPESTETSISSDSYLPASEENGSQETFAVVPSDAEGNIPKNEYEEPTVAPWWKSSSKALLGVGVFTGLTAVILVTTGLFKMDMSGMEGHDMGGMEGMDMGGMSHDEMMGVDGAFNATPVTVEEVQFAKSGCERELYRRDLSLLRSHGVSSGGGTAF